MTEPTLQPETTFPLWAITGGPTGNDVQITYRGVPVWDVLSVRLELRPGSMNRAILEIDGINVDVKVDTPHYSVVQTDALEEADVD